MKTIFGNKAFLGIFIIAVLGIAIQTVSGGGIGLDIDPTYIEVEPGSTITYNITVYNYQNQLDCFVITVIPETCASSWFDWWYFGNWLHEEFICVRGNEQEQVSLNVTPDEVGYFRFKVKAVPGTGLEASQIVWIKVDEPNKPPVEPALTYPTPNGVPEFAAGTAITFNGSAVDPDGDMLYYRFWLKGPATDNIWKIMRDWNADNTWTWKTDTRDIGDNKISVWIRDTYHAPANSYDLEIVCEHYYIIENKAPINPMLTSDKNEPQPAGTAITWTASATDPDGDELYYRFWIKGPATNGVWEIKRDWSTDNTWTWYTSDADVGDTDISVWILDGHHAPYNKYDLEEKCYGYTITSVNKPPCYGILVPTRTEPQRAGTSIAWVAYAEDPDGDTRYYRFWIKGPGTSNSWAIKQDWSTDNIWVWHTTAADIGNTDISVWIRDGHHVGTDGYDLEKKVYSYRIRGWKIIDEKIVGRVEIG